jgi:hypothetical protein
MVTPTGFDPVTLAFGKNSSIVAVYAVHLSGSQVRVKLRILRNSGGISWLLLGEITR